MTNKALANENLDKKSYLNYNFKIYYAGTKTECGSLYRIQQNKFVINVPIGSENVNQTLDLEATSIL